MTDPSLEAKLRQVRLFRDAGYRELLEEVPPAEEAPNPPHTWTPEPAPLPQVEPATPPTPPALSRFFERFRAESTWQNRLLILSYWIKEALRQPQFSPIEVKSLISVLEAPLAWVPRDPSAWEALGRLLTELLPLGESSSLITTKTLCALYEGQRWEWNGGPLEFALWRSALEPKMPVYIRGLAHLHLFLAGGIKQSHFLWLARNFIVGEELSSPPPHDRGWQALHIWAQQVLSHPQFLRTNEREAMSVVLKAAATPGFMRVTDVEAFLKSGADVPLYVLEEFQWFARREQSKSLECKVIELTSQKLYPTNQALSRLCSITAPDQVDLGWRAMTILHSRRSLGGFLLESWRVSGENRKHYFFSPLESRDLLLLLKPGLSEAEWLFVESYLRLAPILGEKICAQAKAGKPYDFPKVPKGGYEEETLFFLRSLKLFGSPLKPYSLGREALKDMPLWGFRSVSYQSKSSMLFHYLAKSLNLHLWEDDYALLLDTLNRLPPHLNTKGDSLLTAAKGITLERARFLLQLSTLRLATAMMPNHFESLLGLQEMSAPLTLLRTYETWLVSSGYSTFRKMKRMECLIPFRA